MIGAKKVEPGAPQPTRANLKRVLVAFAAFAIAAGVAAFALDTWRSYRAHMADAKRAAAETARMIEEHTMRQVQAIDLVLVGLSDLFRLYPALNGGSAEVNELLRDRLARVPQVSALAVVDRYGRPVYHSDYEFPPPLSVESHPDFIAHRDDANSGLRISGPQMSRRSSEIIVPFSRRITLQNGEFGGAVVALVDPQVFAESYAALLSDGVSAGLMTSSGAYLIHPSGTPDLLGLSAADTPLFQEYLPAKEVGTFEENSGRDFVIYRKVTGFPLVLTITLSSESMSAQWWHGFYRRAVVALAIILGLCLVTRALIRHIDQRMVSEAVLERLSREIEQKSGQLELALANMSQGLVMYDADHRMMLCNRRYLDLYNLDPARVRPGLSLKEVMEISVGQGNYRPEQAQRVIEDRLAVAASREPRVLRQFLKNGRIIEVVHRPLPSGGFVATYTDITEQEHATRELLAAKEQAEIASRAKSDFLANMSHELRTPLNAIIGFSQIITEQMFGPIGNARYREYAGDILYSSQHLLQIINDILDMAKIEAGRVELNEAPVDVHAVASASLRLVRERAETAGLALELDVPEQLPLLLADERLLKQVLLNLLSNAIKFTPRGGKVAVTGGVDNDGAWMLSVRDTGIGIAPDDIPKALAPFGQIDGSYTRTRGGTGLGLPIVRALVELHGGTFSLDSAVGRGTTAVVRFPGERVLPRQPSGIRAIG